MQTYVVKMNRYGDTENHSYLIYAGNDCKKAIVKAKKEIDARGVNYDAEIWVFNKNKVKKVINNIDFSKISSYTKIGKELGLSYRNTLKYVIKNNIEIIHYNEIRGFHIKKKAWAYLDEKITLAKNYGYDHPDDLTKLEYEKGKSLSEIAKMLEVTASAISIRLVKLGIKTRPSGGRNSKSKKQPHEYRIRKKMYKWIKHYPCLICEKEIQIGELYHNGETRRKYHVNCVKERIQNESNI